MRAGYQSLPDKPWTLSIRGGWLNPGAAPGQGPPAPERSPAMTDLVTPVTRGVISSPDTPAAFEQFASEAAEPAQTLTLPPPPARPPDQATLAALAKTAARHHITILAPPPQP